MSGSGHPDWQAYSTWRETLIDYALHGVASGQQLILGPYNASNWQSVMVTCDPVTLSGPGTITVTSLTAPSGGATIGALTFPMVPTAGLLRTVVPLLGPSFQVVLAAPVASTGFSAYVSATGVNLPGHGSSGLIDSNVASMVGVSLAAGANNTVYLPYIAAGPASISGRVPNSTGVGMRLIVYLVNADGTLGDEVYRYDGWTPSHDAVVVLPNQPVALQVVNATGALVNDVHASLSGPS